MREFSTPKRNCVKPLTAAVLALLMVCLIAAPVSGAWRGYGGLGGVFADGHKYNRLGTGLNLTMGLGYESASAIEVAIRGTYMWFLKSRVTSDYYAPTRLALSAMIDLKINLSVDRSRSRGYIFGSWGVVTLDRGSAKPVSPGYGVGLGAEFPTGNKLAVFIEARFMSTIGKGSLKDTDFVLLTIGAAM
jgi:hypothetical protein